MRERGAGIEFGGGQPEGCLSTAQSPGGEIRTHTPAARDELLVRFSLSASNLCPKRGFLKFSPNPIKTDLPSVSADSPGVPHSLHALSRHSSAIPKGLIFPLNKLALCLV